MIQLRFSTCIYAFFFLLFVSTSCVTSKKLKMLDAEATNTFVTIDSIYQLQKGDILDIKVTSIDEQSVAIFNRRLSVLENRQTTTAALFLDGYNVNEKGEVDLPMIGGIAAEGLTIMQLTDSIHVKLLQYYKYVSVRVKLINFRVTVLGEVERPGQFYVYDNSMSIFSALSMAGDITSFGDRRKVFVIRKKGTDIKKVRLDIHDPNVIASEYYYCLPNDVIYVEPDKSKATHINLPIAALVISSLSFVLLVFNVINTK